MTVDPTGATRLQLAGVWEAYSASDTAGAAVLMNMAPYLAPEVGAGAATPTPASDVYATGILLYELLAGRPPYLADVPTATAARHATAATPSVRMYNPSVPTVLDEIVKRAMAKEPAARYGTAGAMLSDLRLLQDALRFGRTLTWPLSGPPAGAAPVGALPAVAAPTVAPKAVKPAPAPTPVAPRMSATREEDADDRPWRKARDGRDVPLWLLLSIVFCRAVVLALVGVWLAFNMNRPRLVTVPNIKGAPAAEARNTLRAMKLEMHVIGRGVSKTVDLDHVINVNPPPGGKVREGSQVGVFLSSGSPVVKVPPLKGLTLEAARTALEALNLELDTAVLRRRDRNAPEGTIIDQEPKAKKEIERFGRVRATVSLGDGGGGEGSDQAYRYTLRVRLTDLEKPTNVRVEITDDRETRTIYEDRREDGDRVEVATVGYGSEVVFRIYYDGEVVKEVPMRAEEGKRVN